MSHWELKKEISMEWLANTLFRFLEISVSRFNSILSEIIILDLIFNKSIFDVIIIVLFSEIGLIGLCFLGGITQMQRAPGSSSKSPGKPSPKPEFGRNPVNHLGGAGRTTFEPVLRNIQIKAEGIANSFHRIILVKLTSSQKSIVGSSG